MDDPPQKNQAIRLMSSRPKVTVSVIMPAKNAAAYIHEAIQSVLRQKGVSFELLIADDKSDDQTWEIIKQYRSNPKVRIWRFKKQKGQASAYNFLMKKARGHYLFFCDADDKILPRCFLIFSKVLNHHAKTGVVYGDRLVLESGKTRIERRARSDWDLLEGSISNGGAMIRRSLLKKTRPYRTDMSYLEDCEFFARLYEVTDFLYLKGKPFYIYRKHRRSLTAKFKKRFRDCRLKIIRETMQRRYGFKVSW
jgi:glycosyltransferase involved in cell wall biosynthesis